MQESFAKALQGYRQFREKYATGDNSIMGSLAYQGQKPKVMVVACCDSRVDPGLILQCEPGDLFVVRNVANIVPPYEKDNLHHGTSAALEFGVCFLNVEHLILLGHSQCGGIKALLDNSSLHQDDFISNWVSVIQPHHGEPHQDIDEYAKLALSHSKQNCLTFPWIKQKVEKGELLIHQWFFDIQQGQIFTYSDLFNVYQPLD